MSQCPGKVAAYTFLKSLTHFQRASESSAIVISSSCLPSTMNQVEIRSNTAFMVTSGTVLFGLYLSFIEMCRNTDEMNAEHRQKAPSLYGSIFNV